MNANRDKRSRPAEKQFSRVTLDGLEIKPLSPSEEAKLQGLIDDASAATNRLAKEAQDAFALALPSVQDVLTTLPAAEELLRSALGAFSTGCWLRDVIAREAADAIEKLSESEEHLRDLGRFQSAMDAITKAVDQCSKREALRAIEAAYALGVLAPPTSEMRQKVFAEFRSSEAKERGQRSGAVRRQNPKRRHVAELAVQMRSKNPTLTAEDIADKIRSKWASEEPQLGHKQICNIVRDMEKKGEIPKRTRSPPK